MTEFDLDLDYGNVKSEVLSKKVRSISDRYQVDTKYVNWREESSSVAGDGENKGQFNSWLTKMTGVADSVKTNVTNREGQSYQEVMENRASKPKPEPMQVRILGMKPLVFTLVALGVVIATGIGIAKLGTKATAK